MASVPFTPGARIEVRDAEWRIKRVDQTSDSHYLLTCDGLSELVNGREASFLTGLEQSIRILQPQDTQLVDDGFRRLPCQPPVYRHAHAALRAR